MTSSSLQALGEELKRVWQTFEGVLSEAGQFVTIQTPMKAQGLQQSIEVSSVEHYLWGKCFGDFQ